MGEPALEGEARHHRQGRHAGAAGAGGNWSFLSGEICPGAGCAVVVAAPAARTARWGLTGQKSAEVVVPAGDRMAAGKDRTPGEAEEPVLLVPVALIAVIPRTRASCREETVSFAPQLSVAAGRRAPGMLSSPAWR